MLVIVVTLMPCVNDDLVAPEMGGKENKTTATSVYPYIVLGIGLTTVAACVAAYVIYR